MPEQDKAQRREIYYYGRVQGVGFRYTARSLASRFQITGFVRNLPDGRVQLLVEGNPEEIQQYLGTIDDEIGFYVDRTEDKTSSATGQFRGFDVRF